MKKIRYPIVLCPHCDTRGLVRSSEQITQTIREIRVKCENDECGHMWMANIEATRTIQASRMADPKVVLPVVDQRRRRLMPANDDHPEPANDEVTHPSPEAATMTETS